MRSALTLLLLILVDVWWISCRAYPQDEQHPPDEDQGVDSQQEQSTAAADQPPAVEEVRPCNVRGLMKCFADVLDDWVWYMWNFREKIITVSNDVCMHHSTMHFCANYPGCSRAEVLNYSQVITDAVLQRQNAGTFLKSYFFAEFSCSPEGREIVSIHKECLSQFKLNDKALYLSHLIERNFIKHLQKIREGESAASESESTTTLSPNQENGWFCRNLTENAQEMFDMATAECTILPGYLMCRSLVDAFHNLYPVQLAGCQVPCAKKPESANLEGLVTTTRPPE